MKKKAVSILSVFLLASALSTQVQASNEDQGSALSTLNPQISSSPFVTADSFSDIENTATIFKKYEPVVDLNTRIEFVDPTLSQSNGSATNRAGDRRVYVSSSIGIGSSQITGYDVGPIQKQTFLLSVPKGKVLQMSSSKSVSGTLSISGTYNQNVLNLIKTTFTGSASGTVSKTWSTTETWSGPPESSSYTTRNYYGAINYDQYNSTCVQYDFYDVYLGNTYLGRETETKYYYVNGFKVPKPIEYVVDTNY